MQITKEQADKVIAALEYAKKTLNRLWVSHHANASDEAIEGCKEALAIMRGLADGEPVAWIFPNDLQNLLEMETTAEVYSVEVSGPEGRSVPLYTSPQAAPLQSESLAQAAQAPDRLPSGGKPIEAPAPLDVKEQDTNSVVSQNRANIDVKTESQMREAFEAWVSNDGAWPRAIERDGADYKLMQTSSNWLAWKAAWVRAARKS